MSFAGFTLEEEEDMSPPPPKRLCIISGATAVIKRALRRAPAHSVLKGRLALPSNQETQRFLEECVLHPKLSLSAREVPEPLRMAFEQDGCVHIPRMLAFQEYEYSGMLDQRSTGAPLSTQDTKIVLTDTPPQKEAMAAVLAQLNSPVGGAQLVLPCGFGKTIVGIKTAVELGRTTIIMVSDRGLQRQWLDRLETHAPQLKVGVIQGKKADFAGKDVCVCMVQSLFKPNKYPEDMFNYFGTIIVDEHHMMAAREFSKVVPLFSARNILALSATPERDDGLTQALHWLFGPIAYRCARAFEKVNVSCIHYTGGINSEILYPWMNKMTGKPMLNFPAMTDRLINDDKRNELIVRLTLEHVAEGRHGIVLTSRRDHIETLQALFLAKNASLKVGVYHGDLGDEDRCTVLRNKFDVFISIVQMGKQALDKPELSFLVLATPMVNKYEQAVGRILRPYPNKKVPVVIDILDPYSLFLGMYRKRAMLYSEQGYTVSRITL